VWSKCTPFLMSILLDYSTSWNAHKQSSACRCHGLWTNKKMSRPRGRDTRHRRTIASDASTITSDSYTADW
jgi:hypothetical protein